MNDVPVCREMTVEEIASDIVMHVLALEIPFGMKRDLIGRLMNMTYRHERELIDAIRDKGGND